MQNSLRIASEKTTHNSVEISGVKTKDVAMRPNKLEQFPLCMEMCMVSPLSVISGSLVEIELSTNYIAAVGVALIFAFIQWSRIREKFSYFRGPLSE